MFGSGAAGFEGMPVKTEVRKGNPEAEKYGKMWERDEYRAVSPGEGLAAQFLQVARPKAGSEVIDFGCGTGRGALMLAILGGLRVTMVDFVRNCLDEDVRNALTTQAHVLRFVKADLEERLPVAAEYGFCCDVMEHIPTDRVDRVLANVLAAAQHVFFNISTVDDSCGKLIGESLHLTVKPMAWWAEKFAALGCAVHWAIDRPDSCLFYVSAWQSGQAVVEAGFPLNTADETIREQVRRNVAGDWQTVHPYATNDLEVMILGGGPSMFSQLGKIRAMREAGAKLVTLNGAYNWALEHGITPSATIVCDAREFNKRFVRPVVDGCKYLIASQCHPAVLDGLPKDRTLLWHTTAEYVADILSARYEISFPVPGGSTVLLRAIPLMRMLGYRKFHLFGCDSCVAVVDGKGTVHHGYEQVENDPDTVFPVVVNGAGGRVFGCTAWMFSQAQEFIDLIRGLGDVFELEVHGDGLLAYILEHAAERQDLVAKEEP